MPSRFLSSLKESLKPALGRLLNILKLTCSFILNLIEVIKDIKVFAFRRVLIKGPRVNCFLSWFKERIKDYFNKEDTKGRGSCKVNIP